MDDDDDDDDTLKRSILHDCFPVGPAVPISHRYLSEIQWQMWNAPPLSKNCWQKAIQMMWDVLITLELDGDTFW